MSFSDSPFNCVGLHDKGLISYGMACSFRQSVFCPALIFAATRFVLLAIGIQRVVNRRLPFEQLVIVLVDESEAFGNCLQASRLWREILRICISPSDYWGKALKRGVSELVLFNYGVEGAFEPMMAEFDIRHIERDGAFTFRDLHHLIRWHIEELGLRVNESFDEPGTGDAVHLWSRSGYPLHIFASFCISPFYCSTNIAAPLLPGRKA